METIQKDRFREVSWAEIKIEKIMTQGPHSSSSFVKLTSSLPDVKTAWLSVLCLLPRTPSSIIPLMPAGCL